MIKSIKEPGLLFSARQLMGLDDAGIEPREAVQAKPGNRADRVRRALADYFALHGCGKRRRGKT